MVRGAVALHGEISLIRYIRVIRVTLSVVMPDSHEEGSPNEEPYRSTSNNMTDSPTFTDSPSELPILIGGGGAGEPEQLIIVGARRADGTVPTVAWSGADWSAAPDRRDRRADALLEEIERASRAGRSINQELFLVRRWLRGEHVPPSR